MSAADKLLKMMNTLEEDHGKLSLLPEINAFEQAIYMILSRKWDPEKARKSLELLKDEFVDWNEVRVSTLGQALDSLGPLAEEGFESRVSDMLYFIDRIYRDKNQLSLEFLRPMDVEDRREYMTTVEEMTPGEIYVILQLFHADDELLLSYPALRIGGRLGVVPKTTSLPTGTKNFQKIVPEGEWNRFQYLVVTHAETVCVARNVKCEPCSLNKVCPSSKVSSEKPTKAAASKSSEDKSTSSASGKKKAPRKKTKSKT